MNRRRFFELTGTAGIAALLSACGGDSEPDDHRFANQPMPTQDLGGIVQTPTFAPPRPTVTSASTISPQTLFQVTGTVGRIVVTDQKAFWVIDLGGAVKRFGDVPPGAVADVVALDDASRIGVLTARATGEESVTIFGGEGTVLRNLATPRAAGGSSSAKQRAQRGRLAWSPDGSRLLYARAAGGIDAIAETVEPTVLVTPKQAPIPGAVVWSPTGDAIAFVSRTEPDKSDGLFVGATGSLPIDAAQVVPPAKTQQRAIPELAWLADGARILFTQRTQDSNDALAGDMFDVLASGGGSSLLISSGFASPVSAIGIFAVAPGAEAIAFTVLAPNSSASVFQSLWIKQLDGETMQRLDVPANAAVTGLWWTTRGLVWREQPGSLDPFKLDGPFELRRLTSDGTSERFFESKSVSEATPVASPVAASPVASPVASPSATP
jgi:hypothetical protein